MTEAQQIKEIAKDLCKNNFCSVDEWRSCSLGGSGECARCTRTASGLYKAGYRKRSEAKTPCSWCGQLNR